MPVSLFASLKKLGPVMLVSLLVALVFTASAAVFDQFHQVAAEDSNASEVRAVAVSHNQQVLKIAPWGVTLTLPLGTGLPRMAYAMEAPDSVGLTSENLEQLGANCAASRNAVGSLLRLPAATFSNYHMPANGWAVLGTVAGYDYVYWLPQNSCMNMGSAGDVAGQEAMAISGVGLLAPTGE